MKATPATHALIVRLVSVIALIGALGLAGGCASKSTSRSKRAPSPLQPVAGAETVFRQQKVDARASELLASGKYNRLENARWAAEKEIPTVIDPAQQKWSREQARWQKQKAVQEAFEQAFAKAMRGP